MNPSPGMHRRAVVAWAGSSLLGPGAVAAPSLADAGRPADAPPGRTVLVVALMPASGAERRVFQDWVDRFNAEHPALWARIVTTAPETFKAQAASRLAQDPDPPDLVYWFAGTRLRELAAAGLVAPLDALWDAQKLDAAFGPALKEVVSWRGRPCAVPLNYYQWGLYYRASTFERHGWAVPSDWDGMRRLAAAARAQGVAPVALGARDAWTCAAWFDFLDLRLNGLEVHRAVTAGQLPFTDARVRAVLEAWRELRDDGWFLPDALPLSWRDAAPYLLHGRAATFLMGNFFESSLPEGLRADVRFFPFPRLAERVPDYEEAPTDVLAMARRARQPQAAAAFLAWAARADSQRRLATASGKLPAQRDVPLPDDPLARAGGQLLRGASGLSQFFDRDSPKALSEAALPVFRRFVVGELDVDAAASALEAARRGLARASS